MPSGRVLQRYLAGVGYATGHQSTGHGVSFTQHSGNAPAAPPARAGIWTADATGAGPLTLHFDAHAQQGDLVLVAMNSDGSPSVGGHVATAATVPSLPWIAAGPAGRRGRPAGRIGRAHRQAGPAAVRRGRPIDGVTGCPRPAPGQPARAQNAQRCSVAKPVSTCGRGGTSDSTCWLVLSNCGQREPGDPRLARFVQ